MRKCSVSYDHYVIENVFLCFYSNIVRISDLLGDQDDKKKKTYILRPKDGRTYKGKHDFVEKN